MIMKVFGNCSLRRSIVFPVFYISLFLLICIGNIYSYNEELIAIDNSEIRRELEGFILSPFSELSSAPRLVYHQTEAKPKVTVEVQHTDTAFYILFINDADLGLPIYSRGSYSIKRDIKDGSFVHIKIFYRDDPYFYVRIYPRKSGELTLAMMNVYVMDYPIYENIMINTPFQKLLTTSFSTVINATENLVDWDLLLQEIDPNTYEPVRNIAEKIREKIPEMGDTEDGAQDSSGRYVYINDLKKQAGQGGFNCSGFAKWVADGIFHPIAHSYLDIDTLKEKHENSRGNRWSNRWEEDRDPYFGLDWTRNIAVEIKRSKYPNIQYDIESCDVRTVPFVTYIEDVGFPIDKLGHILFAMALKNPRDIYFGSVSVSFGDNPPLLQHVHVFVLIPFFKEEGRFTIAVFERSMETNLEMLTARYPKSYIHLVSVRTDNTFNPPSLR